MTRPGPQVRRLRCRCGSQPDVLDGWSDVTGFFFDWCDRVGVEVFAMRRAHLDGYVTALAQPRPRTGRPAAASTIAQAGRSGRILRLPSTRA